MKNIKTYDIFINESMFFKSNNKLKTKAEIEVWLTLKKINNFTINSDLTVDVNGSVDFGVLGIHLKEKSLPIQFGKVSGNFICNYTFTTLDGCPVYVGGKFDCSHTEIKSLKGGPTYVGGYYMCNTTNITSLEGGPKEVGDGFDCSNNDSLKTLKGGPIKVDGYFVCNNCILKNLEGSPKEVGGNFICYTNELTSLKGSPKFVGKEFNCSQNELTSAKGCPEYVKGDFYCFHNKKELSKLEIMKICKVDGNIKTKF